MLCTPMKNSVQGPQYKRPIGSVKQGGNFYYGGVGYLTTTDGLLRFTHMSTTRLNKNTGLLKVGDSVRTDFEGRWDKVHTILEIDECPDATCQSGRKVLLSGLVKPPPQVDKVWLDAAWAVPVEEGNG